MKNALLGLITLSLLVGTPARAAESHDFEILRLGGVPVHWAGSGTGTVTVAYAYVTRPAIFPAAVNCQAVAPLDTLLQQSGISPPVFRSEVRAAFDLWEQAANIRFVETSNGEAADILIGAQGAPEGRAFTNVAQRAGRPDEIERSVICLNPQQRWKVGFDGNLRVYDLRYTIAHEIGHAIGLDHPPATGEVMSHRYGEAFRTLQPGDRSGAVALYGPKPGEPAAIARADIASTLRAPTATAAAHN
jgi:hypothetical protein